MSYRPPRGALAELVAFAHEALAERRRGRGAVPRVQSAGGFRAALLEPRGNFPLICEVKRASPSAGALKQEADAPATARAYVAAGARCVSVLTEPRRFLGSLDDLRAVRKSTDVPLLRKDFLVDPEMVLEAAEAGANAVLLIVAAVERSVLFELYDTARELGLDVLLEILSEADLDALEHRPFDLVGVNARDLETLEVDLGRFERLAPSLVGDGRMLVAESGIRQPDDVRRLAAAGAQAALVGESLMRSGDPMGLIRALGGALL